MIERLLTGLPSPLIDNLVRYGSVAAMRAASPLPKNSQELIDREVINVGLQRLVLAADLLADGLAYSLAEPLSVMQLTQEKASKSHTARRTMTPGSAGENAIQDRRTYTIPIYATVSDFNLNIRTLLASQKFGAPLDVSGIGQATRRVNESIEQSCFSGAGFAVDGFNTYGVLTHPDVNTYTFIDSEAWTAAGHSGEDILEDVATMAQRLQDEFYFGPYNLYIPAGYSKELNADFKANSDKSTLTRLQELTYGGRNLRVRVADMLPANTCVMVQMTNDVIDIVNGQEPTALSWESPNGMERFFHILAFMIPRVKSNYDGGCGVIVGKPS